MKAKIQQVIKLHLFGIGLVMIFMAINSQAYAQRDSFLMSISGKWHGMMEIGNGNGVVQKIPMQLHILPTDSSNIFTYRIIYGIDTLAGDRPYLLRVIDSKKGLYLCDEQNTIVLDAFRLGNTLTSVYEVEGNFIYDILELDGDVLRWRLMSGGDKVIRTSGQSVYKEEQIPAVRSYGVRIIQSANLKLK